MKRNKTRILALCLCLLLIAFAAPAAAAADGLDNFIDRYGPLLSNGLDSLTDWLDGRASELAPELRETLRDADTDELFSDLRELIGDTADLDDEALRARIEAVAEAHGIHLVDRQIAQLMKLCRTAERLETSELRERAEALREQLKESAPGGLRGVWNSITRAVSDAAGWVARTVGSWFR